MRSDHSRVTRLGYRTTALLLGMSCAALNLPANGAPAVAPIPARTARTETIPFERFRLDNGLEVILHRDTSIPLVAVNIWYHVGPVNEPKARSGFAHLFEHLMFEGSKHVGPNFDRLLEGVGATNSNGTTSWDRTNYFETVPRQYLELVLWIESDRMGYLRDSITQERLDLQREVVKNERRQSYENAPYGPSALTLLDTLFPAGHPYHGAVIGSMQDLTAATLQDVRDFADAYYTPSNATVAVVGDFDTDITKQWLGKYFGTLRRVPKPLAKVVSKAQPIAGTRIVVPEPVEVPKIAFGWLAPPAYGPDHAPLTLLAAILADGKSSRLHRKLVIDEQLALDVDAEVDANALATIVTVDAQVASGIKIERVEQRLSEELEAVAKHPPTEKELERARKRLLLQFESDRQLLNAHSGESGRAGLLQRFNHYQGDPGALGAWLHALDTVTAEDVSRVAETYLGPANRVTVITEPSGTKS
ncbi:MAG TPA: pitrilysin family protein [Polyangiaceae bacterium]